MLQDLQGPPCDPASFPSPSMPSEKKHLADLYSLPSYLSQTSSPSPHIPLCSSTSPLLFSLFLFFVTAAAKNLSFLPSDQTLQHTTTRVWDIMSLHFYFFLPSSRCRHRFGKSTHVSSLLLLSFQISVQSVLKALS